MPCRYQLQSQEDTKERRHSHTIGGLPESDDQSELPSPPALSMSLSAKGQLTNIGQCSGSLAAARAAGGLTLLHEARQLDSTLHLHSTPATPARFHDDSVYPSKIRLGAECSRMILNRKAAPRAHVVGSS